MEFSLPISRASFSDFKPWLLFSMLFSRSWLTNATVKTLISYEVTNKKNTAIYVDSVHFNKSYQVSQTLKDVITPVYN